MSIITGVSTDKEFLDAINEKGASLTEKSTPAELVAAIDATGGNVSYMSPNEVVVTAVNTEPAPAIVPWSPYTGVNKFVISPHIPVDITNQDIANIIQEIKDLGNDSSQVYIDDPNGFAGGNIIFESMDDNKIAAYVSISSSCDISLPVFELIASYLLDLNEDEPAFELSDGSYYTYEDGVQHDVSIDKDNIVDFSYVLPTTIGYYVNGSISNLDVLIKNLISVYLNQ